LTHACFAKGDDIFELPITLYNNSLAKATLWQKVQSQVLAQLINPLKPPDISPPNATTSKQKRPTLELHPLDKAQKERY
jgi:hypothetical protein